MGCSHYSPWLNLAPCRRCFFFSVIYPKQWMLSPHPLFIHLSKANECYHHTYLFIYSKQWMLSPCLLFSHLSKAMNVIATQVWPRRKVISTFMTHIPGSMFKSRVCHLQSRVLHKHNCQQSWGWLLYPEGWCATNFIFQGNSCWNPLHVRSTCCWCV